MNQEITCIICPKSCKIRVTKEEDNDIIHIQGNECLKGKKYALDEVTDPRRIFTSTVKLKNGPIRMLPVRTDLPIRKKDLFKARELVKDIVVEAPVPFGKIIFKDFIEKGINLIATREIQI